MTDQLLTLLIGLPFVGAVLVALLPERWVYLSRWIALVISSLVLCLAVLLFISFDASLVPQSWEESFQFVVKKPWIGISLGSLGALQVDYHVGVDGIAMPLIVLSAILLVIGVLSSWHQVVKAKGYFLLYLILGGSVIGCFAALDFFLFYVFFEFMLLPMFFLIGIWGGERRSYASIKFFLYTLMGSLFILVVMIGLYLSVGNVEGGAISHTFSMVAMLDGHYIPGAFLSPDSGQYIAGVSVRIWAFGLLLVGFLIKLPAVPLHTWLPDAHVEAPTAISVLLAGLLLKVGGYGLFRIAYPIFPDAAILLAYPIALLGLLSIIYGGLVAMAQNDLKRLVAYSSVSHMGFVLLGLSVLTFEGISGSLFQMISHGFISGALFLIVGVIYDRTHDRQIEHVSGLASKLPYYTFFVVIFFFASLGLPGFSGFVGELLVLAGAIGTDTGITHIPMWVGMMAVLGIIISAAYYLWTIQRMFFGTYWIRDASWEKAMVDLSVREWLMFVPLALLVIILGIMPGSLLDVIDHSLQFFTESILSQGSNYLNR